MEHALCGRTPLQESGTSPSPPCTLQDPLCASVSSSNPLLPHAVKWKLQLHQTHIPWCCLISGQEVRPGTRVYQAAATSWACSVPLRTPLAAVCSTGSSHSISCCWLQLFPITAPHSQHTWALAFPSCQTAACPPVLLHPACQAGRRQPCPSPRVPGAGDGGEMMLGGVEDAVGAAPAVSGAFRWPVAAPRHREGTGHIRAAPWGRG